MNNKNLSKCKAAFSQVDITPDFPVELIGCYRKDNLAEGILHQLYAQILLFELHKKKYCLIAIDSLGLTTELSNILREQAAKELTTESVNIMLNFSHTHSAPSPKSPVNGERYFRLLCDRVIDAVREAKVSLKPCLAGWSIGESTIAENRRDGCSAVDRRLGALQIINAETNAPIAMVLRVSAHANILMTGSNKLSSDYFGPSRDKISQYYGCPVMLIQGASGNLKPVGVDKIQGGNPADLERISDALLQSAVHLTFVPKEITCLAMYEEPIELYSDVPSAEEARHIVGMAKTDGESWLDACAKLRDSGITAQSLQEKIHFMWMNEGCFCGVPDEIFCELSLEAAQRVNSPALFFNGYTNGCTGYLPHQAEWVKGGYETLYSYLDYYLFHGHVMPFRANTAERLVSTVVEVWNSRAEYKD